MQKEFIISVLSKEGKHINMEVKQKNHQVTKRKVKTWTNEEDNQLLELYQRHPKKWEEIAALMFDRNQNQCLHRYRRLSILGKSHKIWSQEEDETIKKLIKKYGKNWKLLSEMLGTKNGKQIRERFINKLDPKIKKQDWSEQEDRKILQIYSKLGSRWSQISKHLPGRPQNKIKNRFYSFIQKNYDICFRQVENVDPLQHEASHKAYSIAEHKNVESQSFSKKQFTVLQVKQQNKCLQQKIQSKFQIPSINLIDFGIKNENMISNNLLESVYRVDQEWRMMSNNYQSILELHSTDLFAKLQS